MSSTWYRHALIKPALLCLVLAGGVVALAASPSEAPFLTENTVAMDKMMAAMVIVPSGDIDKDFVAMMVPHHQGAIDMAHAFLRYGHNEQLKRLAQEIIITQQQEIAVMRLAVGEIPPLRGAASIEDSSAAASMHHGMTMAPGKM